MLTPNASTAAFNLGAVWIPRRKDAEALEALANMPRPRPDPVAGRVRLVSAVVTTPSRLSALVAADTPSH